MFCSTFRTVIELVKRDPSIVNDEDEASNTPLHLAAIEGHVKCCKALLERGAEVDARWVGGMMAFLNCCYSCCNQPHLAQLLVQYSVSNSANCGQVDFFLTKNTYRT